MTLLFTEGRIGTLTLKSRLMMLAIHTGFGFSAETDFLTERVKHGAELVTASMGVHPTGANRDMMIISEENRAAIARMAKAVFHAGGKLCVQLFHVGRNAAHGNLAASGAAPVAPSEVPSPIYHTQPRALTSEELDELDSYFFQAAAICKEAGVHAIEINCSAGYLLSSFLSSKTNLRTDECGGCRENQFRFPLRIISTVRQAAGPQYPVILKISGTDMLGGYTLADMQAFAKEAEGFVDAISVTGGWHEAPVPQITMQVPPGGYAFLAAAIKQAVDIPVIACNRINNTETAEEILREGFADFIGAARAFMADSQFADKIQSGQPYIRCIACNKGCIENILHMKPVTCIFNPVIGLEAEFEAKAKHFNETREKILIVGGGPAGLSAARNLAMQGHQVSLFTKEAEFGGALCYAKKIPDKGTIAHNIETMVYEAREAGAALNKGVEVDEAFIQAFAPDRVVVAAGSEAAFPPIGGTSLPHVYTLKEVFNMERRVWEKLFHQKICIIGGGASGTELAYYLLSRSRLLEQSRAFLDLFGLDEPKDNFAYPGSLTIVEMSSKIGDGIGSARWILLKQLQRYPVTMMTDTTAQCITEEYVQVSRAGETMQIPVDMVILATGYKPAAQKLAGWLQEKGYPYDLIGDCNPDASAKAIMGATKDAFELIR